MKNSTLLFVISTCLSFNAILIVPPHPAIAQTVTAQASDPSKKVCGSDITQPPPPQSQITPTPSPQKPTQPPPTPPLDVTPIPPGTNPEDLEIVTANTISQTGLTIPSLWWTREQFGGKLVENWIAYPKDGQNPGLLDLIVNRQIWSLLDYLQRYQFLNHFGQAAIDYRYNMRVFNSQQRQLATYTCNFNVDPIVCNICLFDSPGLGGPSNSF